VSEDADLHEALLQLIRDGSGAAVALDHDGMLRLEAEHGREGAVTVALDWIYAEAMRESVVTRGSVKDRRRLAMWVAAEVASTGEIASHFRCSLRTVTRAIAEVEQSPPLRKLGAPIMLACRRGAALSDNDKNR
jgi:hypothetical protein